MVWILLSLGGAICTSLTTILAKIGIRDVNSNFATAYRTAIVLVCSLIMCLITGSITRFDELTGYNYLFLVLSGLATGFSWIFYFGALKTGDVNKVAPIDKSSFVLTAILFLIFFFDDVTKGGDALTIGMLALTMVLMLAGTFLMLPKGVTHKSTDKKWLVFAILSAVFAALTSLFVKIGLKGISSDVGTFFRTAVVLIFATGIVIAKRDYRGVKNITPKSWLFLTLSGIATGGAWLLEYGALNYVGANPVAVNCIGKLSILLTMFLSWAIMKEKFTARSLVGLGLLTAGIGLIIAFSL